MSRLYRQEVIVIRAILAAVVAALAGLLCFAFLHGVVRCGHPSWEHRIGDGMALSSLVTPLLPPAILGISIIAIILGACTVAEKLAGHE